MKRVLAVDVDPDEVRFFERFSAQHPDFHIDRCARGLDGDVLAHLDEYDALSVLGTHMDADKLERMHRANISILASRSIGYDNIDIETARKLGIQVTNVPYSPASVAEFSLMLILMSLRKARRAMRRYAVQDYTLPGLDGRELNRLTVGVVGVGRIGSKLVRYLRGMGVPVLANDPYAAKRVDGVRYVDYATALAESDVIAFHANLTAENRHMLDAAALAQTKPGVVIVNCARGPLIDTAALADAIESGHVGAAALDVLENEHGRYQHDCRTRVLADHAWARLQALDRVVLTQHIAFFTLEVVEEMVTTALTNIDSFLTDGTVATSVL